jgi:hypothetical protein
MNRKETHSKETSVINQNFLAKESPAPEFTSFTGKFYQTLILLRLFQRKMMRKEHFLTHSMKPTSKNFIKLPQYNKATYNKSTASTKSSSMEKDCL